MSRYTDSHNTRGSTPANRLSVRNLTIQKNQATIVDDISLDVIAGEVLGLIGPNGAGKSTLLCAMAGLEKPSSGRVEIDERCISTYSAVERAQRIGWVEQLGEVNWPMSVERIVMLGRIPHLSAWGKPQSTDIDAVEWALERADCNTLRHRQVPSLSGGERARVLLARALAAEPSLLFADEPVSALDLGHQLKTMQLLSDYTNAHRSVLVIMHDLSLAVRYCHRLALMHEGQLVAVGEPASVLSNSNIAKVYGVSVLSGCESVPWVVPEHVIDSAS